MNTMFTIIVVIQVLSALTIIGLVLLQHGKGADMGAAFGSGASGSLFGATGSSNFLSKSTGIAAAIFFSATLMLAYLGNNRQGVVSGGVMENLPAAPVTAPSGSAAIPGPGKAPANPGASGSSPSAPAAPSANQGAPAAPATAPGNGQSGQIPK